MLRLRILFNLLVILLLFSCNQQEATQHNDNKILQEKSNQIKNTDKCLQDCQKWCRLGCYATEGKSKCLFLQNKSMPCCDAKTAGLSVEEFKGQSANSSYIKCSL